MIILEIIAEFIIEVIFIEVIGGTISRLNNAVLKLRGIETKSVEEGSRRYYRIEAIL